LRIEDVSDKEQSEERSNWKVLHQEIEDNDIEGIEDTLENMTPSETARTLSRLSPNDQSQLLTMLPADGAADLVIDVPDAQAADMIKRLTPQDAASIVEALPSDERADLLGDVSKAAAEEILDELPPEDAEDLRELLSYPEESAGGVMIREILRYKENWTVGDVLTDLREFAEKYAKYNVQYTYVVDVSNRLLGVVRLRDLVLAPSRQPITEIMIADPVSVHVEDSLEMLHDAFEKHHYIGMPVVDQEHRLIGVVLSGDVLDEEHQQSEEVFLESAGIVGGEELRTMSFFRRSSRRLSWLSVNVLLNILAASVIALHQNTLEAVIILAVFLPIISDMSGCSGNQAVAVSIRELTLGVIQPRDVFRVFWKEGIVGVFNGIVLGALLGGVAWIWRRPASTSRHENGPCSRLRSHPHHRHRHGRLLPRPEPGRSLPDQTYTNLDHVPTVSPSKFASRATA
jgi:magnesium transporter